MRSPRREDVFSADRGNKTSIKEFIGQKQGLSIKRDLPMGASPRRAWWDGWRRRAVHLQAGFKVLEAHFTVPIKHITAVYHFFSHLDITNPFFFLSASIRRLFLFLFLLSVFNVTIRQLLSALQWGPSTLLMELHRELLWACVRSGFSVDTGRFTLPKLQLLTE